MIRRIRDIRSEALRQDPFLLAILLTVGLLVIASLGLFFARQTAQEYLPENTPRAVVNNYLLALQRGDFEKAYSYLAVANDMPNYVQFRLTALTLEQNLSQVYLQLGEVRQSGEAASLSLRVIHTSENPFQGTWEDTGQAVLLQNDRGEWKIQSLPYPFWRYDWYTATPKPVP